MGTSTNSSESYFLPSLVVLCGAVFFYGLGILPFIGPDEPRYAEVAREMYRSGDWITPRLGGILWFEKPALTYWLSAIGYMLFGESEFAARFGVAVFASIGVMLVYFFGKQVRSARFGYLSAAALATCGLWLGFARGATFDLPLSVAIELALFCFFAWERRDPEQGKNRFWWIFCFALGLAVLAKGLVGIVLPAAIIGLYLLLTRRLKVILKPKLLFAGAILFLATAATWYAPVIARNGREFIDEFFIGHHFQRYLSNKYKHPQPFYFFIGVLLAGSFPWIFYFVASIWRAVSRRSEILQDRLRLFLWLWTLVPVAFFSFSGSKLPGYILPVFPAVAMLIGMEAERWWMDGDLSGPVNLNALTALLILAVGVTGLWAGPRALGLSPVEAGLISGVTMTVAIVYFALHIWRGAGQATYFLPFGLAIVVIVATHTVFPKLGEQESLRTLAQTAGRYAAPDERLIFYVNADHAFDYYATNLPLRDTKSELVTTTSPDNIALLVAASKTQSILIASPKRWGDAVVNSNKLTTEKLGEQNFNTRCSPDCDWVLLRVRRIDVGQTVSLP
ncbi:MAG: glycosyltransferase family 39 protein [Acidobacteriota bacterium]|nr:glycosyltransferase family 39 protein [Acidobacteriota bacterium]